MQANEQGPSITHIQSGVGDVVPEEGLMAAFRGSKSLDVGLTQLCQHGMKKESPTNIVCQEPFGFSVLVHACLLIHFVVGSIDQGIKRGISPCVSTVADWLRMPNHG